MSCSFPAPRENPWDWRRDLAGRKALRAFTGRKIRELAQIIDAGPGFQDDKARRAFPSWIRAWARGWIEGGGLLAPQPRWEKGARGRLRKVQEALKALALAEAELRPAEREALWGLATRETERWHPLPSLPEEYLSRIAASQRDHIQRFHLWGSGWNAPDPSKRS